MSLLLFDDEAKTAIPTGGPFNYYVRVSDAFSNHLLTSFNNVDHIPSYVDISCLIRVEIVESRKLPTHSSYSST